MASPDAKEEGKKVVRLIPLPPEVIAKASQNLPANSLLRPRVTHGKRAPQLKRHLRSKQFKLDSLKLQVQGKTQIRGLPLLPLPQNAAAEYTKHLPKGRRKPRAVASSPFRVPLMGESRKEKDRPAVSLPELSFKSEASSVAVLVREEPKAEAAETSADLSDINENTCNKSTSATAGTTAVPAESNVVAQSVTSV